MPINKKKILLSLTMVVVLVIAGFAAYTRVVLSWSFSKGERAGYIQKFSHKGWICKTWEGELLLTPVPGTVPEKFLFSVRDDSIAQKINSTMGKKVSINYEQHKGVPTTCFGETEYYVTSIRAVE